MKKKNDESIENSLYILDKEIDIRIFKYNNGSWYIEESKSKNYFSSNGSFISYLNILKGKKDYLIQAPDSGDKYIKIEDLNIPIELFKLHNPDKHLIDENVFNNVNYLFLKTETRKICNELINIGLSKGFHIISLDKRDFSFEMAKGIDPYKITSSDTI